MRIDLPQPPQRRFIRLAPLRDLAGLAGIQDASNRRLFGKGSTAPGLGEQQITPNGGIDLRHDFAASQEPDR